MRQAAARRENAGYPNVLRTLRARKQIIQTACSNQFIISLQKIKNIFLNPYVVGI
jgi:hypothetical protein